ncbi:MAG: alpha/beta hydrolase [Arcobacter sp.]|nr:MAG: alpha/beta hydrolase [Arcobacter sp.]
MLKHIFILILLITYSYANNDYKSDCDTNNDQFIFSKSECINYLYEEADNEDNLIIFIHGSWNEGTDILKKYAPLMEDLVLNTDVSTIIIALPGYSKSSTNVFEAIGKKGFSSLIYKKEYLDLIKDVVLRLKKKYKKKKLTLIAHSAGASLGTTLYGYDNTLIQNMISIAGSYNTDVLNTNLLSADKTYKNINKKSKLILIYGDKDKISPPKKSKDFYTLVKKEQVNVKLIEVKNAAHLNLELREEVMDEILELLE